MSVQNETDPVRRASATADLAKALHMDRQMARANPMLELAATRLRKTGDGPTARRMEILRVEGLAESGATPVPDLIDRLAHVKDEAAAAEDWEAVAMALDVELHLRHTQGALQANPSAAIGRSVSRSRCDGPLMGHLRRCVPCFLPISDRHPWGRPVRWLVVLAKRAGDE